MQSVTKFIVISPIPQVNISPVLHADECERIIKVMINKFWAVILPPPQAFQKNKIGGKRTERPAN